MNAGISNRHGRGGRTVGWFFFLLAIGLLVLFAVGALAVYELTYLDRIYQGVSAAGIPLGGLTLDEAAVVIADNLTPYPGEPITVRAGDRTWLLSPDDLGVSVDARDAALRAYSVGRSRSSGNAAWASFRGDLAVQAQALLAGHAIPLALNHDENRLAYALKRIAREVDVAPREGALTINGLEVVGEPGSSGRQVDVPASRAALVDLLNADRGGAVDLVIRERPPVMVSVDAAAAAAETLLAEPLMLEADTLDGPEQFAADQATLREWLIFSPALTADGTVNLAVSLNRDAVVDYFTGIAALLDRPAIDARLDFDAESGEVLVLSPSQPGQALDIDGSVAAIEAAVLGKGGSRSITLPMKRQDPRVDSDRIDEMGIVELVSQGTTYFGGSSQDRVHNIVTAAEKFTGVVIPPDAEFSFNEHVGDVTAANGFADSLIIWGDRTAVGIGGGVCQVSTTVFRAAFFGGFPIVERWAHGYIVSWYGEPGLDATIYTPDVDFRFLNDTGHYLLVKPEVDTGGGSITFYLYGTRPDRTVETDPPEVTNIRAPAKPLYQEDASLPQGEIKQVDWAKSGQDVKMVRRVLNADGTVTEDDFLSQYQPWQAVYLYGPGADLPPGALEGPNVEQTPGP